MPDDGSTPPTDDKRLAITVDIWKYIVSVQMHFNDMEMRIRNLYFTILAAALGLLGVVQGKRVEIGLIVIAHPGSRRFGERAWAGYKM